MYWWVCGWLSSRKEVLKRIVDSLSEIIQALWCQFISTEWRTNTRDSALLTRNFGHRIVREVLPLWAQSGREGAASIAIGLGNLGNRYSGAQSDPYRQILIFNNSSLNWDIISFRLLRSSNGFWATFTPPRLAGSTVQVANWTMCRDSRRHLCTIALGVWRKAKKWSSRDCVALPMATSVVSIPCQLICSMVLTSKPMLIKTTVLHQHPSITRIQASFLRPSRFLDANDNTPLRPRNRIPHNASHIRHQSNTIPPDFSIKMYTVRVPDWFLIKSSSQYLM